MATRYRSIGVTEMVVLKALWDHGSATVRDLRAALREQGYDWAYTTVLTMLQRLEAKGYVASNKRGVAHVFRPAMSREKLLSRRLKELANQLCEGTATPLVFTLVRENPLSREEIGQLRALLDRLEKK